MNNETVNRKYKDTVFRLLFKDKSNLLSLFNAVNDTDFSDENDIKITTIENAIYMTSKNDISCIIDMKLNLFEHQSTVNPNMPYRNLEYVTKCLKDMLVILIYIPAKPLPYLILSLLCFITVLMSSRQSE